MKIKHIIYILLALGFTYLIYYRVSENNKLSEGPGAGKGPGKGAGSAKGGPGGGGPSLAVDGIIAQVSNFNNSIEITGNIEANESVVLKSEISGLVTGIFFKEGSQVTAGSVLVTINDQDIQAQLQDALTKENLSATNEHRAKQLLDKGAISQEEYDVALANLRSLKAQTQLVRAQLAKTKIKAPFSGKIGLRGISNGEYISPATNIANLMNTNPVKVNFSIPEKYASQIKVGTPIKFKTDASNKEYEGKVYAVEPGINAQTRTLQIRALAPNPNQELLPGSFAKINLALQQLDQVILVPSEAIIPVLEGKMVYISKNGKAQQVIVEAGTRTANQVVINSGLQVGDTVLTTGAMALRPESKVKVRVIDQKVNK